MINKTRMVASRFMIVNHERISVLFSFWSQYKFTVDSASKIQTQTELTQNLIADAFFFYRCAILLAFFPSK